MLNVVDMKAKGYYYYYYPKKGSPPVEKPAADAPADNRKAGQS